MIPTWLAYGTEHMQREFSCFLFFVFVLQRKMQGSCMKTKGMQFVEQKVCRMHMHDDAMTHAKCDAGI